MVCLRCVIAMRGGLSALTYYICTGCGKTALEMALTTSLTQSLNLNFR